jgi:hypothetical protein
MVTTTHDERWGQMANYFHLIKSKVEIKYFQVLKIKHIPFPVVVLFGA